MNGIWDLLHCCYKTLHLCVFVSACNSTILTQFLTTHEVPNDDAADRLKCIIQLISCSLHPLRHTKHYSQADQ